MMCLIPIPLKIISKGSASDLYLGFPKPIPVAKITMTILEIINPYILKWDDLVEIKKPYNWRNLNRIISKTDIT